MPGHPSHNRCVLLCLFNVIAGHAVKFAVKVSQRIVIGQTKDPIVLLPIVEVSRCELPKIYFWLVNKLFQTGTSCVYTWCGVTAFVSFKRILRFM